VPAPKQEKEESTPKPEEQLSTHGNSTPTVAKEHKKKKKVRSVSRITQTPLIDLARMQNWSLLVSKVSSKVGSKEVRHKDTDGLLPLHWACSGGPPVHAVQSLLDAYPEGSAEVDKEGSTALHFACHYGASVNVVSLLIEANASAAEQQDLYGRTPLHHAVEKSASLDVLRVLADANPEMTMMPCGPPSHKTQRGWQRRTPLFMVWAGALSAARYRRARGKAWDKATLLLEAAWAVHSPNRIHRMVHASVALDAFLPRDVLMHVINIHRHQLREADEDGCLPLAIAAAATNHLAPERARELIQLLIKEFPQAALVSDREGRFPLGHALASGKTLESGVEELWRAAPDLLGRRDGIEGLFPALHSASSRCPHQCGQQPMSLAGPDISPLEKFLRSEDKNKQLESHIDEARTKERPQADKDVVLPTDTGATHLSTIFSLLRENPSIVRNDS